MPVWHISLHIRFKKKISYQNNFAAKFFEQNLGIQKINIKVSCFYNQNLFIKPFFSILLHLINLLYVFSFLIDKNWQSKQIYLCLKQILVASAALDFRPDWFVMVHNNHPLGCNWGSDSVCQALLGLGLHLCPSFFIYRISAKTILFLICKKFKKL